MNVYNAGICLMIIACLAVGFIGGYFLRDGQRKAINFRVSNIMADKYNKKTGWEIVTFFPEHPIEIKEGKECVLYLGIKE
jgi:hypothetical protein